ncbi:unnamed protein product [Pseudo-nitzschia multistriata]|uniref:Uncharacterized protein n=1 Tax=Pseudo-nitzschia multistriata TaxID=183589 RepID=A0A448Z226_9STRA|nr:unnamed protein product [Pseudo-nitzschia multistriata]
MTITNNPLDNDDRLKGLLSEVHKVQSEKTYNAWSKTFLEFYTTDLDPDGILNARDNYCRVLKQFKKLSEKLALVETLLNENGHIRSSNSNDGATTITIRGRRMLTNLSEEVATTEQKVKDFMPKTNADEERFGYDKFELAAVLLQDDFYAYDRMKETTHSLDRIRNNLGVDEDINSENSPSNTDRIVDENFQKPLQNYIEAVESFIEVMEDLGLFTLMKRCLDVVDRGEERDEPKTLSAPECSTSKGDGYMVDNNDNEIDGKFEIKGFDAQHHFPDASNQNRDDSGGAKETKKKKKKDECSSSLSKKKREKQNRKGKKKTKKGSATDPTSRKNDLISSLHSTTSSSDQSPASNAMQSSFSEEKKSIEDKEEKNEDDPPAEGEGVEEEAEFIIYFDPKTNTIGRINRQECCTKSQLIIDATKDGDEAYQDIIEDKKEKQQIILLLKKLEKQRPVEKSWLEAIKDEKAAKKNEKSGDNRRKKKKKKPSKSTELISKRGKMKSKRSSKTTSDVEGGSHNSFRDGSSTLKKKKKAMVADYQGIYRKSAAKPNPTGWAKMMIQ